MPKELDGLSDQVLSHWFPTGKSSHAGAGSTIRKPRFWVVLRKRVMSSKMSLCSASNALRIVDFIGRCGKHVGSFVGHGDVRMDRHVFAGVNLYMLTSYHRASGNTM